MPRRFLLLSATLLIVCAAAFFRLAPARSQGDQPAAPEGVTPGALQVLGEGGKVKGLCPLKHTDVRAEVSGFLSRVVVTQEFENPFKEKIEAVYTFPLPASAAVDDMTMTVGERTVRGRILRREEAQSVYEAARAGGQVASLLEQERPNIFTQSVANIMPGERVTVRISYVETLKYEDGTYEFVFPTVVGPRYIPGAPKDEQTTPARGTLPDTDRVPDASRITPPVTPPATRAGHDISIEVALDAGLPLDSIKSNSHEIEEERRGASGALVRLRRKAVIPNKDFVLRYDVAGRRIADAVLAHRAPEGVRGGFFTLILQPPERVEAADVTPKEIVFVLDTSGSMQGFPIEKAKEAMRLALDGLNPQDTFNLITFSGDTHVLFTEPVPATRANLARAQSFLESRRGAGGTEMMKAIRAALDPSDSQAHVRVVCFMTDGYVGNEAEIIGEVQKHTNARVFSFGIGGSVNRYLLDEMAKHGRGEVEYVGLSDDGSAAARRFHERVRNPILTDITIDWGGLPVADVYPQRVPDLFSASPVVLSGRYTGAARGVVRLKGKTAGGEFLREVAVELPGEEPRHDVLATLWARRRVDDLAGQGYVRSGQDAERPDLREAITQLGLEFRLLTAYTAFVAVEEMTVTDGGEPRRIEVPVEIPEGVSYDAVQSGPANLSAFTLSGGNSKASGTFLGGTRSYNRSYKAKRASRPSATPPPARPDLNANYAAFALTSGGVLNGKAVSLPTPQYPAAAKIAHASGSVRVQITVDESGNVVSANAVGGHTLLQEAAVAAARQSKFTPTMLSGKPVRVTGVVVYNFSPDASPAAAPQVTQLETDEQKRQRFLAKLHPTVRALVERLEKKNSPPAAEEAKFVRDYKAEIQVWLADKSPETLDALKRLGFELVLDPKTAKLVIGRLPIERIYTLAELDAVRYVAPQTR